MKNKVLIAVVMVLSFLSLEIITGVQWALENFEVTSFDQILFTLTNSIGNASKDIIKSFVINCILIPVFIFFIIMIAVCFWCKITKNYRTLIIVKIRDIKFKFNFTKFLDYLSIILLIFIFCNAVYLFTSKFYIIDYIKGNFQKSTFFEENYINPENVNISFNVKKKNLIYIYLESMESTYTNYDNGGEFEKNYISELTNLAYDNLYFSNSNKLGGADFISGSSWTIAAMISHTAGVPLKSISKINEEYENYEEFMPGVYSLGEVLEKNGYKNYLMVGSDATFGGRRKYFEQHGNYEIYDYYTAIEESIIPKDYYVFWGYEDAILFEYAKNKLTEISKKDEPFNFTLLTVDTHTPDGYVSDFCENFDSNPYLNSVRCSSTQVYNFIKWLKKQDFYNDTVIIVTGDHISMNSYTFNDIDLSDRKIYNAFINTKGSSCTTNRKFTTMDMYPTTLSALGATIEGERLGLGTNLFSCEPTLSEQYETEYINDELLKFSDYYIKCITNGNCDK